METEEPAPAAAEPALGPAPTPEEIGMLTALRRDRYADFAGRATRREFWLFVAFVAAAFAGLFLLFLACADVDRAVLPENGLIRFAYEVESHRSGVYFIRPETHVAFKVGPSTLRTFEVAAVLLFLAILVPGLAVTARRFNDVGQDARWLLLGLALPLAARLLPWGDWPWLLLGVAWLGWALWNLLRPAPIPYAPRAPRRPAAPGGPVSHI